MKVRIGTRQSALALVQTNLVAAALSEHFPNLEIEIIKKTTSGDKNLTSTLEAFGGKGAFVSEFEEALQDGTIDLAVHSGKDLPAELAPGLTVAAVLLREDARDVLVWRNRELQQKVPAHGGSGLFAPAAEAGAVSRPLVVGTSSPRRSLQVAQLFPGCQIRLLRGNVPTRLSKLAAGEYDVIVLAAAGLKRLGLWSDRAGSADSPASALDAPVFQPLSFDQMLPAGAQGIIAIECRKDDSQTRELLSAINHPATFAQFTLERAVLSLLGAGCHEPTAVFSRFSADGCTLTVWLGEERSGRLCIKSLSRQNEACSQCGYSREALLSLAEEIVRKPYE